ncbi:TRAP transporter small permease [Chloroflexota bacterium]
MTKVGGGLTTPTTIGTFTYWRKDFAMENSPRWVLQYERTVAVLGKLGAIVTGLALVALALTISGATVSRYLFNEPWGFTEELSGALLLSLFYLPLLYVLTLDRHVRVTLLFDRMPERAKSSILVTNSLLAALYSGFMVGEGMRLVQNLIRHDVRYIMMPLPEAVGAVSIPIGAGLFGLGCTALLAKRVVVLIVERRKT